MLALASREEVSKKVKEAKALSKLSKDCGGFAWEYHYWNRVARCRKAFDEIFPVLVPTAKGNLIYGANLKDIQGMYDRFYEIQPAFYEAMSEGGVITPSGEVVYYATATKPEKWELGLPEGIQFGVCGSTRRNLHFDIDVHQIRERFTKEWFTEQFGAVEYVLMAIPPEGYQGHEYKTCMTLKDLWG